MQNGLRILFSTLFWRSASWASCSANDFATNPAYSSMVRWGGMGSGRVRASLSSYGVSADDAAQAMEALDPVRAALDFARRKRLGPYGPAVADPRLRQRQFAAFARAGHPPRLAQSILRAESIEAAEALLDEEGG